MIRLIQEFGAHAGRQFSFEGPAVHLGRAPTCDVVFDPNVDLDASANHCDLLFEGGSWYITDNNSRNGTYVNGQRVNRQLLRAGDVIECGRGGPRLRIEISTVQPTMVADAPPPAFAAALPSADPSAPISPPVAAYRPVAPAPASVSTPPPAAAAAFPAASPFTAPPAAASPFAAPPAVAAPFAPVRSAAPQGPPSPFAQPPQAAPPQGSVGAAVASKMGPGAKVGARTVGLMIDQALKQANIKSGSSGGMKVAMVLLAVLVLAGLGVGAFFLFAQGRENERRLQEASGNAGERIAQDNENSIYLLAAARPMQGARGFCTGFAVTSNLIATNAHCVEVAQQVLGQGGQIVALRNNGRGQQIPVTPVYRDPRFRNASMGSQGSGFDVGLVQAMVALPTTVRLASNDDVMALRPGAQIFVYGFPGMTMNETSPVATITAGILNRSTDFFDRAADPPLAQKVQHSAQTTSGSSGSPIFLANGLVIGVNAGSLADDERQSIVDPTTGRRENVEVNRSSNFKYGMRADLIRMAIQAVGQTPP